MDQNNLGEIARQIFQLPPRGAGLIRLELDDCVPPGASNAHRNQIIAEVLMTLCLEGIRVRFDLAVSALNDAQIRTLDEYLRSVGYCLITNTGNMTQPPAVPDRPREELRDFSERFYNFDDMTWIDVSFAPLNSAPPPKKSPQLAGI